MSAYEELQGFLIDLDGTVWKEMELIEGAAETIQALQNDRKRVVALSNRGTHSRQQISNLLFEEGIHLAPQDIILTSHVVAEYLRKNQPQEPVWTLGEPGLEEELRKSGVPIAKSPNEASWLIVSLHTGVTYRDLNQAFRAVQHGARIIATNKDKAYPSYDGLSIDVAGMLGAMEATTGKTAEIVVGKPSSYMFERAIEQLGVPADQTIIVGDSLTSDIGMGAFGIKTALVLSGNTTADMVVRAKERPDFVMGSLKHLVAVIKKGSQLH